VSPAIVLAAGASMRYGYANKLLANYHGEPLIAHTIRAIAAVARPIVVVTGHQSARVVAALGEPAPAGVRIVVNRHFSAGLASSLQAGLRALPACFSWVWLCLGDMPGIESRLMRRLHRQARPGVDYVRPVYGGAPGHPVLIARRLFAPLVLEAGDRGAQPVLAAVAPARRRLLAGGAGCLRDADTRQALRCC
jgi:molybdenum cofactor cytidylyltransferase